MPNEPEPMLTSRPPQPTQPYPLPTWTIWVLCLAMTPFCGAVLYHAWKKDHPEAARYANRVSWVSCLVWLAACLSLRAA
jgi:hypothetical protein